MDVHALSGWVKENWESRTGLLTALLLVLSVMAFVPGEAWTPPWLYWAVLAFLCGAVILVWVAVRKAWFSRKDHVRIALAIYCDKDDQKEEIQEDFVRAIRQVLKEGDLGKGVALCVISRSECKGIENDADLCSVAERKKAHFLLYGRIRTRTGADERQAHLVELRALVRHAALDEHQRRIFVNEISSVFPGALLTIPKSDQLPQFQYTADWLGFSARYIISLAAMTVGDLDYAEKILLDAEAILPRINRTIKGKASLDARLNRCKFEVLLLQARRAFNRWLKSRDIEEMLIVRRRLESASKIRALSHPVSHLLAQAIFVSERNAAKAEKIARAAMFDHAISYLNIAFLTAWQNRFDEASKWYRKAKKLKPDENTCLQILSFFAWLRSEAGESSYICDWCEYNFRKELEIDMNRVFALEKKLSHMGLLQRARE